MSSKKIHTKKKRISREIVNGRRTVYFNPMCLGKDRKYILIKKPEWKLKIYIKELSGARHIRFEVTLSKNYFESKRMPKTIPTTTKPNWLERIKLEDFVTFAKVNWERLAQGRIEGCEPQKKQANTPDSTLNARIPTEYCWLPEGTHQHVGKNMLHMECLG